MSTMSIAPSSDELDVATYLCEHAEHDVLLAQDLLDAGEHHRAAIGLLQAAELYTFAALELDPEISPTGR